MTRKIELDEVNLEDMIHAAAANGELTYLSVVPIAGRGPSGVVWSASYQPASKWGSGFGRDADPVKALKMAITDTRLGGLVTELRNVIEGGKPKFPKQAEAALKGFDIVDDADFV